jgi:PAS domain S-box-containing protein
MSIRDRQKNQTSGRKNLKPSSAPSRISSRDKLSFGLIPSQKFFEAILDNIPNPIFIKDRKHRWVALNQAISDLLGCSREKMLEKSDYDFFPKNQADFFWKKDEEVFRTGKIIDIPEESITDKKGKIHYLQIKKAPLRDSSGKITHLVSFFEDITERKGVEELKTIKEQVECILGITKTGVDIIDSKFNIRYIDPEWQKVYGDPTGIKCYKYFMGRNRVCPGCGIVISLKTKKPTVTEEVLVKEGNRPIQVTTIPFQNEKSEWMVAEANVDITERKLAEKALRESAEQLRLVTDSLPVLISYVDLERRYQFNNEAYQEWFGHSRTEVQGKHIKEVLGEAAYRSIEAYVDKVLSGKKVTFESTVPYKDGGSRHVSAVYIPHFGGQGEVKGFFALVSDITERKKAEEALQTERDRLELVTRHIGVGLAIISKDYRTLWANEVLKHWFGDVEGKICYSTYNQRTKICPGCGVRKVFETGIPEVVHEQVGKDKHGKTIWSQIIATPIKDKEGNIIASLEVVVPITHRKLAEEALRESEEKYRLLVENVQEGIYSTHKGIFTNVNESMCRLFGYEREELIGMPAWDLAVPDKRNIVKKMFIEKTAKKDFSPIEAPCVRKDGSVFIAEIRLSALSEKHQSLGVVSDISDRKRTEEALRASENKYRVLLENLPQNIFLKDKNSVYISCNENYARALKINPEEIVGKADYDFYPKELAEIYRADDKRIMKSGKIEEIEERYIQDGEDRFVHTVKIPLKDEQNKVNAILGIFWDITQHKRAEEALRESEEKYRLLVENANEAVVVAQDGWMKFVNPKMTEIMGYSGEELLSKPFVEFIHPDDQKMVLERHIKRIKGEELPQVYSFRIIDKNGNIKWLEINAVVITWEGRPATLNFLSDITKRKQMEKWLIQKEQIARERARLLTDFHNLYEIDDILTRVCEAVRDSGLFERAVMTLHEPGGKIIHLGQVGLPPQIVKRARQAPPLDRKLISRMTHKNFRISDSFFIPVEAGLDLTKSGRYIPQKRKHSVNGDWQAGDELFVPLRDFSGDIMGYLSVDSPFDGCRPDDTTIQALEMLVEAAAARVRELDANNAVQSSERKYRTLVETAQIGIGIIDPEENFIFVNQAGVDLLGYRKDEVVGKKLKDICDETQYSVFKKEMAKRKRGEPSKYEATLLTKSGKPKHVLVSSSPLENEEGNFRGALVVVSDLTEIKKAREYNILLNASRALSQTFKFDQVLKMGAGKMMETLKADKCIVLLPEDHASDPPTRLRVYDSIDGKASASVINLKITKQHLSAYKRALQARGCIQISDARIDPLPELGNKILSRAGMRSSLIIPIGLGERMLAIFHVGLAKQTKTFSMEELGLVQTMANQVGTALQNCRLIEDLERNHAQILQQAELLKTQYREQKMLFELAQALTSSADLEKLLKLACQKVTELLNTERSSIALVNPDGKSFTIRALYPEKGAARSKVVGFAFTPEANPELEKIVAQQEPFVANDTSRLPKQGSGRRYLLSRGIKSTIAVPLISRGKVIGFITAVTTEKIHYYTPEEIRLLLTISNPIAATIDNYLLFENLKEQAQKLLKQSEEKDILLQVSHALSQTMDLDEVAKVGARVVGKALRADRCAVLLLASDGNHLEVKGFYSEDPADAQRLIDKRFAIVNEAKWKNIITKRKLLVTNDLPASFSGSELKNHCLKEGIKSVLASGMFFGKKMVGVLSISCIKEQRTFNQEEMKLIQAIANQIAVAIENARLMEVVKKHTQDLKELSSQLMKVQENERKRIARELHDEVGQMLQSMKMNLDRIRRNLTAEPTRTEDTKDWLIDTEKLLSQTIDDIRTLTFDLRPSMLDDFGLISTLRWYIGDFAKRSNIKVVLKGKEEKYRFPLEIEVNLYRIIQEALTNVAKHAQATEVSIFLSQKDSTTILSVKDNGKGFDANTVLSSPQRGMGIFNMKERVSLLGGSFEIISQPRKGTRVNVKIPFTEVKHEESQVTGR